MIMNRYTSLVARHYRSSSSRAIHATSGAATAVDASKRMRMIILGAPGAGKGTQGERLLKKWDITSVGVGDLLRQEILKGTELGKESEAVMKAGGLLPDQIVLKLVKPELMALKNKSWILDGFPRKLSQAVLLDDLLQSMGEELNFVVSLNVPDEVILSRIEDRWVHPPSGRVYNNSFNPSKVPGKDDVTGDDLQKRPDDTAEIFAKRLFSFHTENNPLLSHYASASTPAFGTKLVTLSGRTSNEIYPQLEKAVEEKFPGLELRS